MKNDLFHILNRGVEKRKIFFSEENYLRFTHNFYDLNTNKLASPYPQRCRNREKGVGCATSNSRNFRLVDGLCWCLMPNHPHVLVQEKIDGGTSIFSKKIFEAYTKYINEKHRRSGVLFQGRSKIIPIKNEPHFFYLPFYIMSNPIELIEPKWKDRGINNLKKVIDFLENCFRWSSFPDLVGKQNFPFVINKKLFYEIFDTNEKKFKKDFIEWLGGHRRGGEFEGFID